MTTLDRRLAPLARIWPALSLALLLALITLGANFSGLAVKNRVIEMLIDVVLVVGFYSFAGTSGVLSFGHMSFMSIGAYVGALLTIPVALKAILLPSLPSTVAGTELALVPAALIAGAVAATAAAVISIPLMRLPNLAISLGMFAVLVIVYQVESNWSSVTRGRAALVGIPTNTSLLTAFAGAVLAIVLVFAYQESRPGLRLRASRDDELAAASVGVNVENERRFALMISAFILGSGGVLYAQYLGVITPNSFYLDITFITIAMLVIGGTRSLAGAVIGPLFVTALTYLLQQVEKGFSVGPLTVPGRSGLQQVGLALVMLLVLIFRPRGLTGGRELPIPWRLRSPSGPLPERQAALQSPPSIEKASRSNMVALPQAASTDPKDSQL